MEVAEKQKLLFEVSSPQSPALKQMSIMYSSHITHKHDAHQRTDADTDVEADEEVSTPFPDLMEIARCFEQGGVSRVLFGIVALTVMYGGDYMPTDWPGKGGDVSHLPSSEEANSNTTTCLCQILG